VLEYIKRRQKELEARTRRAAELEAARVAKLEAEAHKQWEAAARKKLLLEQQEAERRRQKYIQKKEKLAEQKWDEQLDILLTRMEHGRREDDKLEEIRIIIQNREPSLEELNWASWLSSPLNQKLADLDLEHAMEMFKRDNLMAKRRHRTRGKGKSFNYALVFTGDGASGAEEYVTTDFNPDDYNLNLGFTVSYWVRPDEVGTNMFAFGRKHSNSERFVFGISQANKIHIGTGGSKLTGRWDAGLDDNASGQTAAELFPSLFDDGDLKTGNWLHFVVTYADRTSTADGGVARIVYLNGELIKSQNVNWSATGGGTGGMYFGARNLTTVGYNYGWACGLDEVAIFNTAKDADWVTNVYNNEFKANLRGTHGLVGYWKFNEGKGTTVQDLSGNGNHGTFADISGDTTAHPTWEKRVGLRRR
jgi:hypothetical protein